MLIWLTFNHYMMEHGKVQPNGLVICGHIWRPEHESAKSTVRRNSVQQLGKRNVILSIRLPTNSHSQQRTTVLCSTYWQFATHSTTPADLIRQNCWTLFEENPDLHGGVGRVCIIEQVEEFICRLYGAPHPFVGVDQAQYDKFEKGHKELERLPPTKDALGLHFARSNVHAKVWLQASVATDTAV